MDKSDTLKLCPRLKESMLHPTHFQKMNVRLSASLLNSDVAAAISFYVNQNILEKSNETTAWFLRIMHKWFKYMTGRYCKYA
jgi:hypothetical protein